MADDPITKLPINNVFQGIRLNGWWHCGTEILMNNLGNMLIRPTPVERFMLRRNPIGSPQAHLRMSYATSLMLWVIRSRPDFEPDWWTGVVSLFYKNANKRLKPVPKNLRQRLLDSLHKAGVTYTYNNRTVRDMMVDTSLPSLDEATGQEPNVDGLVTDLLVAFRLNKQNEFNNTLNEIVRLQTENQVFRPHKHPRQRHHHKKRPHSSRWENGEEEKQAAEPQVEEAEEMDDNLFQSARLLVVEEDEDAKGEAALGEQRINGHPEPR